MDDKNSKSPLGSLTNPVHIVGNTWNEETKNLEKFISLNCPFEGKWQSYISEGNLIIPDNMVGLFDAGGVIATSTENHLWIFGLRHWERMQRIISKKVGLSPINNETARHVYQNMHRFKKPENNQISIPNDLLNYAGIDKDVVIIGMVFFGEIYDKNSYKVSNSSEAKKGLLNRFKKIKE